VAVLGERRKVPPRNSEGLPQRKSIAEAFFYVAPFSGDVAVLGERRKVPPRNSEGLPLRKEEDDSVVDICSTGGGGEPCMAGT